MQTSGFILLLLVAMLAWPPAPAYAITVEDALAGQEHILTIDKCVGLVGREFSDTLRKGCVDITPSSPMPGIEVWGGKDNLVVGNEKLPVAVSFYVQRGRIQAVRLTRLKALDSPDPPDAETAEAAAEIFRGELTRLKAEAESSAGKEFELVRSETSEHFVDDSDKRFTAAQNAFFGTSFQAAQDEFAATLAVYEAEAIANYIKQLSGK